jgi:DNA-binding NarL/FixJ family response regulator
VIRLFLISGIRLYRDGLADLIAREVGFVVVGTAEDRLGAVACILELPVDVVLVDMARASCLPVVRSLTEAAPDIKILGLAVPETDPVVVASAEAGIAGFVSREASIRDLIAALKSAVRGEALCSPKVAASLLRHMAGTGSNRSRVPERDRLTSRELQVVDLMEEGLSNKEIARRLSIALATVKNHVHNILTKLEAPRRTQAVAILKTPRV